MHYLERSQTKLFYSVTPKFVKGLVVNLCYFLVAASMFLVRPYQNHLRCCCRCRVVHHPVVLLLLLPPVHQPERVFAPRAAVAALRRRRRGPLGQQHLRLQREVVAAAAVHAGRGRGSRGSCRSCSLLPQLELLLLVRPLPQLEDALVQVSFAGGAGADGGSVVVVVVVAAVARGVQVDAEGAAAASVAAGAVGGVGDGVVLDDFAM